MSRNLCFIVVAGITRPLTDDDGGPSSLVKKLKEWFPNCRCIVHNPFMAVENFTTGNKLIEEQARLLLHKVSLGLDVEYNEDNLGANKAPASPGLVFLGHDIGGSLIMKALILACTKGSSYRHISGDILAIVFFGVLQRAQVSESWDQQIVNLFSISPFRTHKLFANTRKDLPDVLSELSELFSGLSGSYKIFNVFQQPWSTRWSKVIVSQYSATNNAFISEDFGAAGSHTNLCDIHDGDPLAEWLKLKLKSLEDIMDETISTSDQYRNFVRELARIDPSLHQLSWRTSPFVSMNWVNSHSGFKKWVGTEEIGFLHICGSPGSGATVHASHIVGLIRQKHLEKETYFLGFSFNNQDVYGSSTETMILSFIRQFLSQGPALFRHIVRLATWITQRQCSNKKTLWVLFWSLISHIEDGQLVIIIRAIQESSSPVNEIVDYLYSLRGLPKLGVKIIITSDHENAKAHLWGQRLLVQHLHTIRLENDEDARLSVKKLVRSRVDRLFESRASCRDLGDIIMDKFWPSTPNLYWATAKVDILEAQLSGTISTRRALLEKLEHFPSTIDGLFNLMVQRISLDRINWIQPGKGLSWIMYALRPLTSSEFAVALAFDQVETSTTLKFDEFGDTTSPDLPGDINRIAGPWVEVEDGKVSVNGALKGVILDQYPEDESVIETMLLLKCIRYLVWIDSQVENAQSIEEGREPRDLKNSTQFGLAPYASVYWLEHFKRAAPVSPDVLKEVLAFLEGKLQFWSSLARKFQPNLFSFDASESPLKIAASLGLTQVVDEMLSRIEKPVSEEKETLIQESMMLAIEHGQLNMALRLYEMQSSCKAPQLHKAASGGFNELLRGFLAFDLVKASINSYDAVGYTPLHYAAQHGHADTVNLLLENGASAKLMSDDGAKTTALHLAVRIASLDIIVSLIKSGADVRARDSSGYNAVALSAEGGFDELVRYFMADDTNILMVQDSVHDGNTPLHLAAMYGHASMCEFFVQLQADFKAANANHETPLHLAVRGGFRSTVELLLKIEKKGQEDAKKTQEISGSEKGETESQQNVESPLQIAAKLGYTDIINLLLQYNDFATSDNLDKALRLSAAEGHTKSIKSLLGKTTANDPADSEGNTALHLASSHGRADSVRVLLDSEKFDIDFLNQERMTALHLAARGGYARIVLTILKHQGSAEIKNTNGDTPMHLAAARGNVDVVKLLYAKYPSIIIEGNGDNETPLVLAAKGGHVAVVKELLHVPGSESKENGSAEVWGDFYPLHTAASKGYDELVRVLVTEENYNINIRRDPDQQTPIHAAMQSESTTMIPLLIDLGADITAADEDRDTALHFAASMDRFEACKALLSHMSDSGIEAIDRSNDGKETPLYRACYWGHTDVAKLLLDNGADCNKHCTDGWTPLHVAAAWRNRNVVRLLLDKTADHHALNDFKSTPIILAAGEGYADVTAMLIEAGAVVDWANSAGSTALHCAARDGYLDCVKLLVEKGYADYNRSKNNGLTPLHLAAANGYVDVVEYLLEKGAQLSVTAETFGSPLESAMKGGQFDVVEFLVGKGATTTMDMSEPASWGKNAKILEFARQHPLSFNIAFSTYTLQQAIISFDKDLTLDLLEKIPNLNEECEPYKTVLQAAAWMGATSVMEELLKKSADPNIKGGKFGSALHAAIMDQNLLSVKLLFKHGADPAVEHEGEGAIFFAFRVGNFEVIIALLDKMDSTARSAKDRNGRSLLACAICLGNKPVADYLISQRYVSIQDKDLCGRTPLMEAVLRNNADMVKTLLEMEADPNASDTERKTPLIRAIASPSINKEIITALLEHPDLNPALKDCRGRTYAYWAARLGLERDDIESDASEYAIYRVDWLRSSSLVLHAAIASGMESVVMDAIDYIQSEDLDELDGDGWTTSYTATRYKMENIEEFEAKMKDLFGNRSRHPTLQEPWKWHEEDKSPCLQISGEGKRVTVMSRPGNPDYQYQPVAVVRADHAMPGNQLYYFEIKIMEDAKDKIIGVGFCEEHVPLDRMLGWDEGSWGYHGDDGNLFISARGTMYGPPYGKGDIVGCGVDFDKEVAFFTLNGEHLGEAFQRIKGKLYPAVCFESTSEGCCVLANFGQEKFKFDASAWDAKETLTEPPPKSSYGRSRNIG